MSTITRHDCGFAIFNECDPTTCCRECFTARAIEINDKYAPQPAKFGPVALSIIFIVSVAALAWSASVGLGRVERVHQEQARV